MWLAVGSTGLNASNASSARVLVHGACGGLGQLSLRMLHGWGCRVTAICAPGRRDACLALGAEQAVERGPGCIEALPDDFDVTLNFGAWEDDARLTSRLGSRALGHATTVHPLLANFDRLGWLRGALANWHTLRDLRARLTARAPAARYDWTVFSPQPDALAALAAGVADKTFRLPVGVAVPFEQAGAAFEHVAGGRPGRAVLLPSADESPTVR